MTGDRVASRFGLHSHLARSSVATATLMLAVALVGSGRNTSAADLTRDDISSPPRGVVRAIDQATISTDLALRAISVGFKEGDSFKRGDVLIEFDCKKLKSELAAAEAQHLEMKLTVESNAVLQRSQAVGRHDLEVSRARMAKAKAEADAHRARTELCTISAPFDGRVSELTLNAHETPQPGKPFISIVAVGTHEIDLVLSSEWLRWLKIGTELKFSVDETQTSHSARIVRLGAVVDAISQTVKAVAVLDGDVPGVLPGMSGTADFRQAGR